MANTLKFGDGVWATKKGSTLAYNDENGNFKPLPFTTTRSTSATRVNKEGLIEVVSNDVPRIDYTDSEDGALLLEPSSTNLVTHSEDFSNASWTKLGNASGSIPILTTNYALSPDGTQNATRLQCDLNGGVTTSDQSIIYDIDSSNTSQTISIYLKSNNGKNQEVYLANTFGANDTVLITSKWKRYVFTHTSSNHTFSLGTRGSTGSSDVLDILIWGAQSESGNLSSYIPTQGAVSTRSAETASGSGNSEVFNDSEGVLFFEGSALADIVSSERITISNGTSSNNRLVIEYDETFGLVKFWVTGGGTTNGEVQISGVKKTESNKISVLYKADVLKIYINGFNVGNGTGIVVPTGLDNLKFEQAIGGNNFYGKTKQLAYYDTVLTDLELETLTSYKSWESMVKELNLNIIHNE